MLFLVERYFDEKYDYYMSFLSMISTFGDSTNRNVIRVAPKSTSYFYDYKFLSEMTTQQSAMYITMSMVCFFCNKSNVKIPCKWA